MPSDSQDQIYRLLLDLVSLAGAAHHAHEVCGQGAHGHIDLAQHALPLVHVGCPAWCPAEAASLPRLPAVG
jgi:hypothetical protein